MISKYEKALCRVLSFTFIGMSFFVENVIFDNEFMTFYAMPLLLILYPLAIVLLFLLISNLPMRSENENKNGRVLTKKIFGLSYKLAAFLGITLLSAMVLVIIGTIKSSSIVLNHHKQLFDKLSNSENFDLAFYEETSKAYDSANLIKPAINDIKNNPTKISLALPWRVEVTVSTKMETDSPNWVSTYWVLTYVNDGYEWHLDDWRYTEMYKK